MLVNIIPLQPGDMTTFDLLNDSRSYLNTVFKTLCVCVVAKEYAGGTPLDAPTSLAIGITPEPYEIATLLTTVGMQFSFRSSVLRGRRD